MKAPFAWFVMVVVGTAMGACSSSTTCTACGQSDADGSSPDGADWQSGTGGGASGGGPGADDRTDEFDASIAPATIDFVNFVNGDFELPGPTAWPASREEEIPGWIRVLQDPINDVVMRDAMYAQSGSHALKMWGSSAMYQDLNAEPGEVWRASAFAMHSAPDALASPAVAVVRLCFVAEDGAEIGTPIDSEFKLTPLSEPDVWHLASSQVAAPEGAARARIMLMKTAGAGSAWFDDAVLERVP